MDYYKEFEPNEARTIPVIKGTQVTLNMVLAKLSQGVSNEDIIKSFPEITKDKIHACLMFATELTEEAYTERMKKAKIAADKFRNLKDKPFVFKDASGKETDLSKL